MSKFSAFRQDPDDALAANANVPEPEEAGGAAAALERAQIPAAYSKFCMALSETLRHSPPLLSSSTPRPAGAAAWRGLRGRRCWRRLRALGQAEPHRGKGEERRDGTGCGMMRDGAGWCGMVRGRAAELRDRDPPFAGAFPASLHCTPRTLFGTRGRGCESARCGGPGPSIAVRRADERARGLAFFLLRAATVGVRLLLKPFFDKILFLAEAL